ncbi:hypothetical protein D3C72_2070460 [compost metagenome]
MAHELGDIGGGAHQVGRIDGRDGGNARPQLGRLYPAHVQRAGLHLLHHRCFIAQLAGMEDDSREAAIGLFLQ